MDISNQETNRDLSYLDISQETKLRCLEMAKREEEKSKEEKERAKKNSNFVMMYRDHMPEMRWLIGKSGIAANILNFIMEHMNNRNVLMASYAVFTDYFKISISTVKRAIKLLYDNGFLDIMKSGTSNVYIVNQVVAWNSYDNEKISCKFDGKILISAKENKDYIYTSQFDRLKMLRIREKLEES